jgi:anti-sigma-K factor RskA
VIHLTPEQLLDVAEGTRAEHEFPHLAACVVCARQLSELRSAIAAAAEAAVPEPSPLFWNHLSERVRAAVAEEPRAERPGFPARGWWRFAAAAAVVMALMLVIAPALRRTPSPGMNSGSVESPAELLHTDVVLAFDDDPALTLLADLSAGLDWEAAAEAGLVPADGAVDGVVLTLSDEERLELHRLLEEALAASGA